MDVLNYVWLANKAYYDPSSLGVKAPLPVEYLNHVLKTVLENPAVETKIWIDRQGSEVDIDAFWKGWAHPRNLSLADLNDIKPYRDDPLFQKAKASIWQKCDLLRLLVLDHVLSDQRVKTAFYSDFDFHVPPLESDSIRQKIAATGWVFTYVERKFENSFVGLCAEEKDVLHTAFIPLTQRSFECGFKNGYSAFYRCAGAVCDCGTGLGVDQIERFALPMQTLNGPCSVAGKVSFDKAAQLITVRALGEDLCVHALKAIKEDREVFRDARKGQEARERLGALMAHLWQKPKALQRI